MCPANYSYHLYQQSNESGRGLVVGGHCFNNVVKLLMTCTLISLPAIFVRNARCTPLLIGYQWQTSMFNFAPLLITIDSIRVTNIIQICLPFLTIVMFHRFILMLR